MFELGLKDWSIPLIIRVHQIDIDLYVQKMYINYMRYEWNSQKNEWLKNERNISFEQIIYHLSQGDVWKTSDHPNQREYPGQKIYFVIIEDYIYLVPYVTKANYHFLKTIIPSRKATRIYREERENEI